MRKSSTGSFKLTSDRMFIIAEAGVNHDGQFDRALDLVRLAKQAGADAVKFQAFTAEGLSDLNLTETKEVAFLTGGTNSSFAMYKALELSEPQLRLLQEEANRQGILFFASVFDEARADFLQSLDVPAFKVASGDLTHAPLLARLGTFGKPVILSTGMAHLEEVKDAVRILRKSGCNDIFLLHCTSEYPPLDEEVNLNAITTMRHELNLPVGYSDHTMGLEIPLALAAMKIPILEKHFTLNEQLPGPDHKLSLGPDNFKKMVEGIRKIERAMGSYEKKATNAEKRNLLTSRRGAKAAKRLIKGETLSAEKIRFVKPASGFSPALWQSLEGSTLLRDIQVNQPITEGDLEPVKLRHASC